MKHNWIYPSLLGEQDLTEVSTLQSELNISRNFAEILWRRGLHTPDVAFEFLNPTEGEIYTSYKYLYETDQTANYIIAAIKKGAQIIIYGDYDVDGITSTSLLWRFLYRELEANVRPFIPNRSKEGYGLNKDTLNKLVSQKKEQEVLLITVDCGARDQELISELKNKFPQLGVVVTDHHQFPLSDSGGISLPTAADKIVHPLHPKSNIKPKEICACGVVWNLICCMRNKLNIEKTKDGLELVALATVCDIMPLIGVNRAYVKYGLQQFANTSSIGLKALAAVSGLDLNSVSSYHLGYVLGPRLNATGRIGDPTDAVRLLSTQSMTTAQNLARKLDSLNQQRQKLTTEALDNAAVNESLGNGENIIILENPEWEEGIIGLIAGKLHEKYQLPTLVLTRKENGYWVGSARSSKKVDITALISTQSDKLVKFGGHVQAAGITVSDKNLPQIKAGLLSASKSISSMQLQQDITADLAVPLEQLNNDLAIELTQLEPYGAENYEPKFLVKATKLDQYRLFGQSSQHLRFPTQFGEILWFNYELNQSAADLANFFSANKHDIIINVGFNTWKSRTSLQFKIKHHRLSNAN